MRAVITVVGHDMVGILAKVSTLCAEKNINVLEVTQSILRDLFCMIMLVDMTESAVPFTQFNEDLSTLGDEMGLAIRAMHEDIFNSMHKI